MTEDKMHMMTTKWDLISQAERDSLDRTKCELHCSGCGLFLETEGDFARHFILTYGIQYKNLGACPTNPKWKKNT